MRFSTFISSARRRAITLIEVILYLVISLSLITSGIVFFTQAQESARIDSVSRSFAAMVPAALSLSAKADLSDIAGQSVHEMLYKAGFISDGTGVNYNPDSGNLENPWGYFITMSAQDPGIAGENPGLVIRTILPKAACLRVSENIWTIGETSGLKVARTIFTSGEVVRAMEGHLSPPQIAENCFDEDTGLVYYLDK